MIPAAALAIASLLLAQAAHAASIARFFGSYTGVADQPVGDNLSPRDLAVEIARHGDYGFTVEWTSVTHKKDGRHKRKTHRIEFKATERDGVFRSAMRKNMFGQLVPNDPMQGEPYVWATLSDDTLVVHALHVLEDGHYEMQTYRRTLAPYGLMLEFERLRDAQVSRRVSAKLERVK